MSFLTNNFLQITNTKLSFTGDDFFWLLPEFIVLVTATLIVIVDLFLSKRSRPALGYLALIGYAAAIVAAAFEYSSNNAVHSSFNRMFVRDNFTTFFDIVFLIIGILTVFVTPAYVLKRNIPLGEVYSIQAYAVLGMMLVAASGDLMIVFVGIELVSIASYILTAFGRGDKGSAEGALKYFLLGIFATAILVYGMAWTFGMTGSTNLADINKAIATTSGMASDPGLTFAMLMLIVGFGFKIAAVPFHVWTPDAYEGAPTPITAFMSVGPKAAGFAALLRVMVQGLPAMAAQWSVIIAVLAVLTMTLGNVVAIAQKSVKRMLAYSSIAHTGYIMVGLAAYLNTAAPDRQKDALSSVMIYSLIYAFMNIGAFGILIYVQNRQGGADVNDFNGLALWSPAAALAMAVCLLSLTGIPPTGGFLGKFYVFRAAIDNGYTWLAVVGVLNSAVSAYFYLRVIYTMYFYPVSDETRERLQPTKAGFIAAGLAIICVAILVLGIIPDPALNMARDGAAPLLQVVQTAVGH
ncbi:MAG TPA: NADH-quinone oxidoreductase subunit N [Chloroflexia bacterium]|nr:NADH-quinone oxidoreductase subunit N [Chloroflexia bacterium]